MITGRLPLPPASPNFIITSSYSPTQAPPWFEVSKVHFFLIFRFGECFVAGKDLGCLEIPFSIECEKNPESHGALLELF